MTLLDDFFAALQVGGNTPWAQEAARRMLVGADLGGIDEALAERKPRQAAAGVGKRPPPPSADVRNPGVGQEATTTAVAAPQQPAGWQSAAPAPVVRSELPDARAPAQAASAQAQGEPPMRAAPIGDPIAGPNPIAKALGLDKLGIGAGNERERMAQLTYDEVLARTGSKAQAELARRDPRVFVAMLPHLSKKQAEWKMEKVGEDENGRGVYAWTNPLTREMRPVVQGGMPTVVSGGAAQPAVLASSTVSTAPAVEAAAQAPTGAVIPPPPPGVNPIEWRKEMAKKLADAQAAQTSKEDNKKKVGQQFKGGLEQLMRFPEEFGKDAFERAVGPLSANDPNPDNASGLWGSGLSVPSILRMGAQGIGEAKAAMFGGAAPTEVRDRLETATKNLAAVMKPLIRAPGEGAWSDKDQANLEAQLGTLTRSRSVEEYNRRLGDIRDNLAKIFQIEVGELNRPPRSAIAPAPAAAAAPPASDADREAVRNLLRSIDGGAR